MGTVLVVDDSLEIRHIIRLALARINILVIDAHSAEQALDLISESSPNAVITDVHLPVMNGVELSEEIHKIDPNIPIIFMSGSTELMSSREAAKTGKLLEKPFKLAQLQTLIQDTLSAQVGPHVY